MQGIWLTLAGAHQYSRGHSHITYHHLLRTTIQLHELVNLVKTNSIVEIAYVVPVVIIPSHMDALLWWQTERFVRLSRLYKGPALLLCIPRDSSSSITLVACSFKSSEIIYEIYCVDKVQYHIYIR